MSEEDQEIQYGHSDLNNTSAGDFLIMVQNLFDTAPPDTDPYFEVDFEDKSGFLRTVRIVPVLDEVSAVH